MRASLSLQLALYRKQQSQIRGALAQATPAFRQYEARYRAATKGFRRVVSELEVDRAVANADVVYVGDYHTLKLAQQGYLELVKRARAHGQPVVLALELVEGRHQKALDAFQRGALSEREFLRRIGHPYGQGFDVWPHFRPVLAYARKHGLKVVAIDARASGPHSLQRRDRYAAQKIARAAAAKNRPKVLVLMGQFHVAPEHLPNEVARALGKTERKHLVVYQNAEGVYWALARKSSLEGVRAVEVRDGALCLISTSPVICQQSFLDYLEAESGDRPLSPERLKATFSELACAIGDVLAIDVREQLRDVEVATAADLEFFERLEERGTFQKREMKALKAHVLSRESAYIPRARMVYLASLSLNHAAEEAAHFVRHVALGDAMTRPRALADAFWSRCLEEALGFFGSKLVNPSRRCTQLDEWRALFSSGSADKKPIAAFVLALKAAEHEGPAACRKLLPLQDDRLFHGVSHALGYLMGDALFRHFDSGHLSVTEACSLFHHPFEHAGERYAALSARVSRSGA